MSLSAQRAHRRRGFTLSETLIALGLGSMISAFVLMIVRSNLTAYELSDQLVKAQENGRTAIDFVETMVRRVCGGVSQGVISLAVPGVAPGYAGCFRFYDGATLNGGSFTGKTGQESSASDAIELVYPNGFMTLSVNALDTVGLTVGVYDKTGFNAGDLVLIGDNTQAYLFKIASIGPAPGVPAGLPASAGTLVFQAPPGPLSTLTFGQGNPPLSVYKAASYAIYVEPNTPGDPYAEMLMLDPDGMAGTTHADAQPIAEAIDDFQVAVGVDTNNDGILWDVTKNPPDPAPDEWYGNQAADPPFPNNPTPAAPPPWNQQVGGVPVAGSPQLRSVRLTIVARTSNFYTGQASSRGPYEDRGTYPPFTVGNPPTIVTIGTPRYRAERAVVAPRTWNLNQ